MLIRIMLYALVLSALLVDKDSYAQTPNSVSYLGIEHGLSSNHVTKIYQDRRGFMWIGTYDGLNRYDGYSFHIFRNDLLCDKSLPDNRITDILEDNSYNLWVSTKIGIAVIDPYNNTAKRVEFRNENGDTERIDYPVNTIGLLDGVVFAGGEKGGLLRLHYDRDHDKAIAQTISLDAKGGIERNYNIRSLTVDLQGTMWLMVQGVGLCYYDKKDAIVRIKKPGIEMAWSMTASSNGDIWMAHDNGVTRYRPASNGIVHYLKNEGISGNKVVNIFCGSNNEIWACTDGEGIVILNSENGEIRKRIGSNGADILRSKAVFSAYADAQKRIWIGTLRGGISIIDPAKGKFELVKKANTTIPSENYVLSLAEGSGNKLWIGTDGAGLFSLDRNTGEYLQYSTPTGHSKITNNYITSLINDRRGSIWIATYNGGINRYDENNGQIKRYLCRDSVTNQPSLPMWKLFLDSRGRIWASTLNGGKLFMLNREKDIFDPLNEPIEDVISIYQENDRIYWFGSWSKLTRYDIVSRECRTYTMDRPVRFVIKGKNNKLWIGTEGAGLLSMDVKTLEKQRFTEKDGLPSNTLLSVLADDDDNFWISTYHGLCRFSPETMSFQNFYESDGLQSNLFSYNAALKTKNGRLAFGGIKGLNIFNPKEINTATAPSPPAIVLTDMTVNNRPFFSFQSKEDNFSGDINLTVPYDDAILSIAFSALEYSFPDKIKYAYMLTGWDKDWTYVGEQRTAQFTNLKEGKYTFKVKSTDALGNWIGGEQLFHVTVLPPWFRSPLAYLCYLLVAIGALYLYYLYIKKRARLKYRVRLAEFERRRERELNEKKLTFFTHMAHEFRTPLTLIVNPIKDILHTREDEYDSERIALSRVYNNSKRLLNLVDKLLLFRQSENDLDKLHLVRFDLVQLCREVFDCFEQYAQTKDIDFKFSTTSQNVAIIGDREKVEICLFNLISNALKYTPQRGNVHVELTTSEHTVLFNVYDSGAGIPPQVGDDIFNIFHRGIRAKKLDHEGFGIGLYLTKKIAEAHFGKLTYVSELDKGSIFTLELHRDASVFDDFRHVERQEEHALFSARFAIPTNIADPNIATDNLEKIHQEYKERDLVIVDKPSLLVVDDDTEIRSYIHSLFQEDFHVLHAENANEALEKIKDSEPTIIISDIVMGDTSGIDLCGMVKENPQWKHILFILVTGSTSDETKLEGLEYGADDYITKPFDKDMLLARVKNLIKGRNRLQAYFYNEITLQSHHHKISDEYKDFLQKAIYIVEGHLTDQQFNVKMLVDEMGMSHSFVYKKIKAISGKSANEFIRFIRLRKVAKLLIDTDDTVSEAAYKTGFSDLKHFRQQFFKLFGENPSEYRRKYQSLKKKNTITLKK